MWSTLIWNEQFLCTTYRDKMLVETHICSSLPPCGAVSSPWIVGDFEEDHQGGGEEFHLCPILFHFSRFPGALFTELASYSRIDRLLFLLFTVVVSRSSHRNRILDHDGAS